MPTAVAILGIISDHRLLIMPIFLIMTNSGIAPASALIIMVATTKQKRTSLPGKRYFAKANPARAQKNSVVMVPMIVVKRLLYRLLHIGTSVNRCLKFSSVGSFITNALNPDTFSPTVFTDIAHIHSTGKRQTTTTSSMKKFIIKDFVIS